MEFIEQIDRSRVAGMKPIAESDQFAIYAIGDQTYMLVQRHEGTPWTAIRLSGDAVFRVGALFVEAMRHMYRDVASHLSPLQHGTGRRKWRSPAESSQRPNA
jgi:hypothetical protein